MAVGGKFDDMMAYPGELVKAVKEAREASSKRESAAKAQEYIEQAKRGSSTKNEEAPKASERDTSVGGKTKDIMQTVKARKRVMADL